MTSDSEDLPKYRVAGHLSPEVMNQSLVDGESGCVLVEEGFV